MAAQPDRPAHDGIARGVTALVALAVATALAVAAAPLVVYAATLALFGWAHVVVEMRYVRDRFAGRLDRRMVVAWLALLAALAATRVVALAGGTLLVPRTVVELALLAALLLVTARAAPPHARSRALLVVGVAAMVLLALPPAVTLALLAIAHNVTPVGFLAERLEGEERRRALLLSAVCFVGVPLLLFLGAFDSLLAKAGVPSSDGGFLAIGDASDHFSAFLAPAWRVQPWSARLFAVAVYLQCAHYFVVLHVLPRLAPPRSPSPPPSRARRLALPAAAAAIGGALLLAFFRDFPFARSLYGVAAAVHAWIEWPLFLAVAFGAAPKSASLPAALPARSLA